MFKNVRLPEPVRRLYRRGEGYFRALIDPSLSVRARILSGAKGLAAIGALGLALFCRVRRHFDPVYAEYF